ncbi:MAG: endonuclease [Pseudobacteriovorax sp.]|nr:endonuclease [Pseudobacteriovorax sp.]
MKLATSLLLDVRMPFVRRINTNTAISISKVVVTASLLIGAQSALSRSDCPGKPETDTMVCLKSPDHRPGDIFLRSESGRPLGVDWPDFTDARLIEYSGNCRLALVEGDEQETAWVSREVVEDLSECGRFEVEPEPEITDPEPEVTDPDETPVVETPRNLPSHLQVFMDAAPREDIQGCSSSRECEADLEAYASRNIRTYGYSRAREFMFQEIHAELDNSGRRIVYGVYTGEWKPLPNRGTPNHQIINTEHTFPQSRLKKGRKFGQSKADLLHLFPTISDVNSTRSSLPFSDCGSTNGRWKVCGAGFEPPTDHKGAVARAMFYMSIVYDLNIAPSEERTLKRWNDMYPVTEKEIERSYKIFGIQGNRNPFVDNKDWVNLIADY